MSSGSRRAALLGQMPELERRGRSFVPTSAVFGAVGLDRDDPGQEWIDALWALCDDGLLIGVAEASATGRGSLVSVGLTNRGRATALGRPFPERTDGDL